MPKKVKQAKQVKLKVLDNPKPKQVNGAVQWTNGEWHEPRCYFCNKMDAYWEIHLSDESIKYSCGKCLGK